MRKTFHQFFPLTEGEVVTMLTEALICYDANVLLNVYRYSEETQKGLEEVFSNFKDRTRLPHQVALEYARNRAKTIVDQVKLCQDTEESLKKVIRDFIAPKYKQPFLSAESTTALNDIIDEVKRKKKSLEAMISNDKYAEQYFDWFDQKIGDEPDGETLKRLHEQAADRYAKKIPPGYSDLKDKEVPRAYGDYIVWHQLMDLAKKEKKDFIFVTDDSKEDWRLTFCGKTIGPRPELLEEFRRETGQRVWLPNSERFLIAMKKLGLPKVAESIIKEVGEHLIAQTSALASEDKLSSPSIDYQEANGSASDAKLSSRRVEHAEAGVFGREGARQEDKLTTPVGETAARTDKKTAVAVENNGGEE